LDLLTYSIYIFVSLTRLFLNLYTAHSDVGGTVSFVFIQIKTVNHGTLGGSVCLRCVCVWSFQRGGPSALLTAILAKMCKNVAAIRLQNCPNLQLADITATSAAGDSN
jgi:hypothetical protein